ncbi:hypothetical protein G7067_00930 [Leucobacter insecticola]|uniref:Uncharacterized protein n=1 Tax=Leucobacter insecticola TaxID=2714934 RepID=A0A6G8FFY3_9MICO|nr:PD40 domain-containing protein [Leucobacter insecticola]QIM15301.1 hypothetical protein G7067_00930 [Leucobacter insecticola]
MKVTSLVVGLVLLSGCAEQGSPPILADPSPDYSDHLFSRTLAVSSDGAAVIGDAWGGTCVWDAATGSYEVFDGGFLALSPDGSSTAAWEKDGSISVRDLQSRDLVHTFEGLRLDASTDDAVPHFPSYPANLSNVAFSADGALVAGADAGGRLLIWDTSTEQILRSFEFDHPVQGLVFDPQGERLALLQETGASQLDIDSGEILGRVKTQSKSALSWSPDGTWLAGADADGAPTIWRADDFSVVKSFPGFQADGIALSAGAGIAFTASQETSDDSRVFVWFEGSGDEAAELPGRYLRPGAVAWAPDGKTLYALSFTSGVFRWDSFAADSVPTRFEAPPRK